MITLGAALSGDDDLNKLLGKLSAALNTKEILDQSGALLLNRIRTRFLAQVDPEGKPWEPSKAALKRAKTNVGGGTLYNTGTLFHSIQVAEDGANGRRVGTDVPYGLWVNYGTVHLPPRIFMDFNAEDVDLVGKFITARIVKALT